MTNTNTSTFDKLMDMNLSQKAKNVITNTDMDSINFLFGDFETPGEVEQFIEENYE